MRLAVFVCLGIFLLALDGALCRVFHLEWIHPDPVLILVVYAAMFSPSAGGAVAAMALGWAAGNFAGTPPGLLMTSYVLVWIGTGWMRRFIVPSRVAAQLGVVFLMSLFHSLLALAFLSWLGSDAGVMWVVAKAMLPLALIHVLLALPIWSLASKLWPGPAGRVFS